MNKIILCTLLTLSFAACKKTEPQQPGHNCNCVILLPDYISFGRAFGECGGDCARFYEIRNNTLYGDNMSNYSGTPAFNSSAMSSSQLTTALAVPAALPQQSGYNDTTFGCPDCHDQGGLHVSFRIHPGDPLTTWHADTDSTQQPPALRPFFKKVNDVIDQLP